MSTAVSPPPVAEDPVRSRWSRVLRAWLWGWAAVVHLVLTTVLALPALVLLLVTLSSLLGAAGIVTIPTAVLGLALGFLTGVTERWRLAVFTGHRVPRWAPRPAELPAWRRILFDARPWRAQLHLLFTALWGLTGGLFTAAALVGGIVAICLATLPPDIVGSGTPAGRVLWAAAGTSTLLVLPLLARLLVLVDRFVVRQLLGRGTGEEVARLSRRVDTLTQSRQAAVDSVDAERRRIERDLHDGPQQRLVAVAMDLGLAREHLAVDPGSAADLLERAHANAKEAIVEMRRVARGIHPPVLTDRGLDAALSALAARSPVPVAVRVVLPRRPAARLEAIAYFCVSEALTNVTKHSRARAARVLVEERYGAAGPMLVATVTDDGVGGADPTRGSGLAGLRDRAAAVDGRVLLASPPGGPTTLAVELPFAMAGEQPRGPAAPATLPATSPAMPRAASPAPTPAPALPGATPGVTS